MHLAFHSTQITWHFRSSAAFFWFHVESPHMPIHVFDESNDIQCTTYWWHINNCNVVGYHCSRSNVLMCPRQPRRVCHYSLGKRESVVQNRALGHVHILENIPVCNSLHGPTLCVKKPWMPDVHNIDVVLLGSKGLLLPDHLEINSVHPIPTPDDTHDILSSSWWHNSF